MWPYYSSVQLEYTFYGKLTFVWFIQHKTRIVQNEDQNIIYPEINYIEVLHYCV